MEVEALPLIPPQTFLSRGETLGKRRLVSFAGLEEILAITQEHLGISSWQMARLLGSNWPGQHMNGWKRGRNSMGSLYMTRLAYLWYLKYVKHVEVCSLSRIDWDTGIGYTRRKNGHRST